ncbi:MAG: hypothetical protein Q7R83_01345 [bacterium]|nr:hypothetical protein [bacterium]
MPGFLRPLFDLGFWFHVQALPFTPVLGTIIYWFMVAVLIAGLVTRLLLLKPKWDKEMRRSLRGISALLLFAGATGLLLYAFTWQLVPVLSMRFFYLVWLFAYGWWAYRLVKHIYKEIPLLRKKEAERAAYEKWLPKPKNRH